MEMVIGVIVAILSLLFFKRKADKAEVDAKLAETRGRDAALIERQEAAKAAIKILDQGIDEMRKKKEVLDRKRVEDRMSLKERADRIKKGLK